MQHVTINIVGLRHSQQGNRISYLLNSAHVCVLCPWYIYYYTVFYCLWALAKTIIFLGGTLFNILIFYTVLQIRIWNYNKSRVHVARGARAMQCYLDSCLIFDGEIVMAPGTANEVGSVGYIYVSFFIKSQVNICC